MANGSPTMSSRLAQHLFKLQTTFGSAEASLTASDFIDAESGSAENDLQMDTVEALAGAFSQTAQVPGLMPGDSVFAIALRTGGDDTPGYWSDPLQCGGMLESNTLKVYQYNPTYTRTEWKDGTHWRYSGDRSASGALLAKIGNCMYNWEITGAPGKVARIQFTGKGAHQGAETDATQPTVTRATQSFEAVIGATVSLMGYAYKMTEFSISANFEHDNTLDINATYGVGHSIPTDLKIGWKAKVYAVTVSEDDAFADLLNGTTGAFSIQWGTAPNQFTLSSPNNKAQITSRKLSEENNVQTLDLEGIFVDNDFRITVDCTP